MPNNKNIEGDAQLDQLTFISNPSSIKKDHRLFFSAQDDTCFETIVTKCPNQFKTKISIKKTAS